MSDESDSPPENDLLDEVLRQIDAVADGDEDAVLAPLKKLARAALKELDEREPIRFDG